jgi:cob(I)alamin adenosyltransferase
MRLYTGRGDQGDTDLLGARVEKDDPRIELIGALDETTSALGFARSVTTRADVAEWLIEAQRDLYQMLAELAFTPETLPEKFVFGAERVERIGALTDQVSAGIELPRQFIVPGDTVAGAALDVARTTARRAERRAVSLRRAGQLANEQILAYLNRLSSLLFVLARAEDAASGQSPLQAKSGNRG